MTNKLNGKKERVYKAVRLASIAVLLALGTGIASAQPRCSVLDGSYAFQASGTFVNPAAPTVFAPFNIVGVQTFDPAGTFSVIESASFPGFVMRAARFSGTYTLNANCTGTMTAKFADGTTGTQDFVVSEGGRTIYAVGVDPVPVGGSLATKFTKLIPGQ